MISAALTGFLTAFSLILAIGAQNAFVLRQGLRQEFVFAVCLFCALSDAVLIAAGVLGFGALTARFPALPVILTWGGAAFLFAYGLSRFCAAWVGGHRIGDAIGAPSLVAALGTVALMTWANPHVYLDTLGLIGAVSTGFAGAAKTAFAIGAVAASFTFFFALGYGARLLAPAMRSPRAWVILDGMIGVVMIWLALSLVGLL